MSATKIMVAYDGSECSRRALEWALASQKEAARSIDVVTVVSPMVIPVSYEIPNMGMDITALHESQKKVKLAELEQLQTECAAKGHTITTHILDGNAAETLLEYSATSGADLLVTGSRGESGFTRLLLGSIAQKLVTYAKIPVVVVK